MANGESGVLIWSAPGNVAEGLCTPTASVTTPGKFQNVRLIHALCFLKLSANLSRILLNSILTWDLILLGRKMVESIALV